MYKLEPALQSKSVKSNLSKIQSLIGSRWYYHDDGLFPPGLVVNFQTECIVIFNFRIIITEKMDSYYIAHKGVYQIENGMVDISLEEPIKTNEIYWKKINNICKFRLYPEKEFFICEPIDAVIK